MRISAKKKIWGKITNTKFWKYKGPYADRHQERNQRCWTGLFFPQEKWYKGYKLFASTKVGTGDC